MEVIRGRERDCRQEIRPRLSADEREKLWDFVRAGKRSARLLTKAHSFEGRCVGGGRWLERRQDRRGSGHQRRQRRAGARAIGGGRVPRGADPRMQSELRPSSDFRRRGASQADRACPRACSDGLRQMDVEPARRESRRTEHRREGQRQHDRAHAKKKTLSSHSQPTTLASR